MEEFLDFLEWFIRLGIWRFFLCLATSIGIALITYQSIPDLRLSGLIGVIGIVIGIIWEVWVKKL